MSTNIILTRQGFVRHFRLFTWNTKFELHLTFWHEIGNDIHLREWTYLIVDDCCKPKTTNLGSFFFYQLKPLDKMADTTLYDIKVTQVLYSSPTTIRQQNIPTFILGLK